MSDTFVLDMLRDLHDAGMTWKHIARAVGVHDTTVYHWRKGTRQANGYSTFRLARLHRELTRAAA